MQIEVSTGEIVDKFTIVSIKLSRVKDENKLKNIMKEYQYLDKAITELGLNPADFEGLFDVNRRLWDIEDRLREKESLDEFDSEFIELARKVYINNDERAVLKKQINIKYQSAFIEEKYYTH